MLLQWVLIQPKMHLRQVPQTAARTSRRGPTAQGQSGRPAEDRHDQQELLREAVRRGPRDELRREVADEVGAVHGAEPREGQSAEP